MITICDLLWLGFPGVINTRHIIHGAKGQVLNNAFSPFSIGGLKSLKIVRSVVSILRSAFRSQRLSKFDWLSCVSSLLIGVTKLVRSRIVSLLKLSPVVVHKSAGHARLGEPGLDLSRGFPQGSCGSVPK